MAQEGQLLSEEEDQGVCLPPTILPMMLGKRSLARPWGTSLSTPQHPSAPLWVPRAHFTDKEVKTQSGCELSGITHLLSHRGLCP